MVIAAHGITVVLAVFVAAAIHFMVVAMVITAYITVVSIHLMVVACKFSGADFSRLRPTEIGCRNSKWSHVRLMAVYTGS